MDVEAEMITLLSRLREINAEVEALGEELQSTDVDDARARHNEAYWIRVFEPVLAEHKALGTKIHQFSTSFVGNG